MKNSLKNLCQILVIVLLVSACSKGAVLPPPRVALAPISVNDPSTPPSDPDNPNNPTDPDSPLPQPCDYWTGLMSAAGLGKEMGDTIQLFDNLQIIESEEQSGTYVLAGTHNLQKLPQVLFALSSEANNGAAKLNPPSIDEFFVLVKESYDKGELSWIKFKYVEYQYNKSLEGDEDAIKFMIDTRNEALVEKVEAMLPGVFTGAVGPLKDDLLLDDLMRQTGSSLTPEALYSRMKVLQKEVALFPSGNWLDRQKDVATALAILNATANDGSLLLTEKICRFAIMHRFTAQILAIKGMEGAPLLKSSGLLADLPQTDKVPFPSSAINGVFGAVVNESWINEQLETPSARPAYSDSTEDFLHFLNYVTSITSVRSPNLWSFSAEPAEPGTLRLNASLLKLGIGLFGFTAKVMAKDELNLSVPDRILLRQDTADNLALLGNVAMNISESFSRLKNPNQLETELLTPEQIASFVGTTPPGVVPTMDRLTLGLTFEGLTRLEEGRGSEPLKAMIRRVGIKTGNNGWSELE